MWAQGCLAPLQRCLPEAKPAAAPPVPPQFVLLSMIAREPAEVASGPAVATTVLPSASAPICRQRSVQTILHWLTTRRGVRLSQTYWVVVEHPVIIEIRAVDGRAADLWFLSHVPDLQLVDGARE